MVSLKPLEESLDALYGLCLAECVAVGEESVRG